MKHNQKTQEEIEAQAREEKRQQAIRDEQSRHRAMVVNLYQTGQGGSHVVNAYQLGRRLW